MSPAIAVAETRGAALREGLADLSWRDRALFDALYADGSLPWVEDLVLERTGLGPGPWSPSTLRSAIARLRLRLAGRGWTVETASGRRAYRLQRTT